jgi:hypothetical protein
MVSFLLSIFLGVKFLGQILYLHFQEAARLSSKVIAPFRISVTSSIRGEPGMELHICNPRYWGYRDWEDCSSGSARVKYFVGPPPPSQRTNWIWWSVIPARQR